MGHAQSTAATATIREIMLQCHMHLCPNCLVVTPCKMGAQLNNNTQLQHLGLGVSHLSTPQGKQGLKSDGTTGQTQSMAATATIREMMLQCHMHLCPNCFVVTPK